MLGSCWQSSEHCRYRAHDEIGKALRAPPIWLRVHHLEAAERWFRRAAALGDNGLWDHVAAGSNSPLTGLTEAHSQGDDRCRNAS